MKLFTNTKVFKKIVIAILLVMTFNFIAPFCPIVRGDVFGYVGGVLFDPICELFLMIGDLCIQIMQDYFYGYVSDGYANDAGLSETANYVEVRYGPALIFSNKVPTLDVNFFAPMSEETKVITESTGYVVPTEEGKEDPSMEFYNRVYNKIFERLLFRIRNHGEQRVES